MDWADMVNLSWGRQIGVNEQTSLDPNFVVSKKSVFCNIIYLFILFILAVLVVCKSIGFWFLNCPSMCSRGGRNRCAIPLVHYNSPTIKK